MKVLIIDNYDSFTYNIVHFVEQITDDFLVLRNDEIDFSIINKFDKIILSPGPGLPKEAGKLTTVIKEFYTKKSILGICLGHQAIGEVLGLKLRNIQRVKHGEQSFLIEIDNEEIIFKGLSVPIQVGHYHSWVIDESNDFKNWMITAKSENLIMAISHKKYDLKGLQFHPESIMTIEGCQMIKNWLNS